MTPVSVDSGNIRLTYHSATAEYLNLTVPVELLRNYKGSGYSDKSVALGIYI